MSAVEKKKNTKTTFSVSEQAVNDIGYIVDNHNMNIQEVLDYICEEFNSYNQPAFADKKNFLTLSIDGAKKFSEPKKKRKSWTISRRSLVILKKMTKTTGLSRNDLVEGGIRTYRSFMDFSHPEVRDQLIKYRNLMEQISSVDFYVFNNFGIPYCNTVFENGPQDILKVDSFQEAVEEHFEKVDELCRKLMV